MDELEANHSFIVKEFKNSILKYEINHNQIKKPVLNHIKEYGAYNEIQKKLMKELRIVKMKTKVKMKIIVILIVNVN